MLRFLSIKRLAVIDAVEVEFDPGLNVLTGETGAGKSILVEAVGLLLGGRASGDLVRTGEETATIEAIFESGDEEIHVRREITAQGRSRAFINGALATAGALKDLSARLIELHGQHEHHTLLDPATHLAVLDAFGDLESLISPTVEAYEALRASSDELQRVQKAVAARSARQEFLEFQLGELDKAALKSGEDEALESARQVLANADRIERLCTESYAALHEDDGAILAALSGLWRRVSDLAALDPQFRPYLEARDGIKSQLEDLAFFLRHYRDSVEASPARLQEVEERLALIERLKRKYGPSLGDVIDRRAALRQELTDLESGDTRLAELQGEQDRLRAVYLGVARTLSDARHRAAADLRQKLERLLAELAMERTRFEVRFGVEQGEGVWTPRGTDQVEFFVSPNPGEDVRPLARVASGGELSRIMLAIKTLTATARYDLQEQADRPAGGSAPGLVFDEVDAGIGGRVADVVGRKLRALGSTFQVLCITHLPQIAACADTHVRIEKRVDGGRTRTTVDRLNADARIEELSRMIGGAVITDAVRASAREMLGRRGGLMPPDAPAVGTGLRRSKHSVDETAGQAKAKGERRKV